MREMLLSSEHVLLRFEHFAINYSTRIATVKQLTLAYIESLWYRNTLQLLLAFAVQRYFPVVAAEFT